ncbi:MAG: amino acid ABC transporter permease, partial [Phycicoccus sp.]
TAYAAVIPAYALAAVLFILLNYGLTLLANRVERRLNRRGRTAGPVARAAPGVNGGGGTGTPGVQ